MLYKDEVPLDDARRLAEVHIENDDILALTYLKDGEAPFNLWPLPSLQWTCEGTSFNGANFLRLFCERGIACPAA